MPRQVFGTYANVLIRSPSQTSPAIPIPTDCDEINVRISRENWPALGCLIELQFSFDNQATWETKASSQVAPFIPTPKILTVTPAEIGWGWNSEIQGQPTHARGRITTATNFRADIELNRA